MTSVTTEALTATLDEVVDPCSAAMGFPIGLVEMGLVESVHVDDDGRVDLRLCVTSPCCTFLGHLAGAARRELERVPGVRSARVTVDAAVVWTPARLSTRAAAGLAARREQGRRLDDLRPHDWTGGRHGD